MTFGRSFLAGVLVSFLVAQLAACGADVKNSSGGAGDTGDSGGAQTGSGAATIYWTAPSTNEDGTTVSLSGFNIYAGSSSANLQPVVSVGAGETSYVLSDLPPGTVYFAVTAVSVNGMESSYSTVASATFN